MKFLAILATATILLSQNTFTKNGMPFLRLGHHAVSVAQGNTGVAGGVEVGSIFVNAATGSTVSRDLFSASSHMLSLDRTMFNIMYTRAVSPRAFFSLAWIHASVDNLHEFSYTGEKGAEIDYGDNAFLGAIGFRVNPKFSFSLTAKYISQSIGFSETYEATAVAVDLGAFYQMRDDVHIGIAFRDLAKEIETNSEALYETIHKESLPSTFAVGVRFPSLFKSYIKNNFALSVDYIAEESVDSELRFGASYEVYANQFLRLGLENGEFRAGLGIGTHLFERKTSLNYSFSSSSIGAGNSHSFSWVMEI